MSDSHGKTGTVSDIVDNNLGKAQMFIHLGDGENETETQEWNWNQYQELLKSLPKTITFAGQEYDTGITVE